MVAEVRPDSLSTIPQLRYVPPHQPRSRGTLDAILDATEELLREKDFDAVQVREVVKRAGSSIGSFYARFRDKDALLLGLHERVFRGRDRTREEQLRPELWAGVPLVVRVHAMVRLSVSFNREHAGFVRALVAYQGRSTPSPTPAEVAAQRAGLRPWIEFLLERREEMDHPDPERAVPLAMFMAQRAIDALTLTPPVHGLVLEGADDEELAEAVAGMMLRMLGARGQG